MSLPHVIAAIELWHITVPKVSLRDCLVLVCLCLCVFVCLCVCLRLCVCVCLCLCGVCCVVRRVSCVVESEGVSGPAPIAARWPERL